jgi:GntR family transcriptional regulator
MILEIDPDSPIPVFQQIVEQVIFDIASGGVEPGSLIPSVRDLAQQITVHPNTVAKAYQKLEERGVLEAKRGRGMEVTPDAPKLCRMQRQEIVRGRIRNALREAVASALSPEEVRQLVDEELHRVNGKKG